MRQVLSQARELHRVARLRSLSPELLVARMGELTTSRFAAAASKGSDVLPVVIPAHNEERDLPATLAAVAAMGGLAIVVSNKSTDRTVEYATRMGAQVLIADEGRKMAATHAGIHHARAVLGAKRVLFTDADTLPTPQWGDAMQRALSAADTGRGAIAVGDSIALHSGNMLVDLLMSAWRLPHIVHRALDPNIREAPMACGHNMAISFDEQGAVERSILDLSSGVFIHDDVAILQAAQNSGANAIAVTEATGLVMTRGDRINTVGQVVSFILLHKSWDEVAAPSYAAQYNVEVAD